MTVTLKHKRLRTLTARLVRATGATPDVVFGVNAPLRVCPLGAHVDHQGGAVTGLTIDRSVMLAAVPLPEPVLRVESLDFKGRVRVDLTASQPPATGDWGDYARAAAGVLSAHRRLDRGLYAVIGGDLAGAGLSSSAAVLICYLLGLARANRFDLDRRDVATLVQRAENSYIGVASGLLDQSIILFAGEGHLTHVNVSDLSVERVTAREGAPEVGVVVAFSGISRALAGSGFNTRVEECHEAARILLERGGRAASRRPLLSDVEPELFDRFAAELPESLRRRATHFFGERRRVIDGVEAWRRGDLARFGELMSASGESSIRNYECGTPEMVTLYELLRETPGVYGARFSGAGFGGSCVALADPAAGEEIADAVSRGYAAAHPGAAANARCHLCTPSGPARFVDGDF